MGASKSIARKKSVPRAAASPNPEATSDFGGHIDFHGYHAAAKGWFVGGWITLPSSGHALEQAAAIFADQSTIEATLSLFYRRDDLGGRRIGFVFFFQRASEQTTGFLCTLLVSAGVPYTIYPSGGVVESAEPELAEVLKGLVSGGEIGSHRQQMETLLFGADPRQEINGFIDLYGHHSGAAGWLFCGWISRGWQEGQPPEQITVSFEMGSIEGEAFAVLYPRNDLNDAATGIAFFVSGGHRPLGRLTSVSFTTPDAEARLRTAPTTAYLQGASLLTQFRTLLALAAPGLHRDTLFVLLARQPYQGTDTLATLSPAVFLEIDEAIRSGTNGLVIMGWCLSIPNKVRAIRVRCGPLISLLRLEDCIRIDRPDVIEAFGQYGFTDSRCGFIAWLPDAVLPDDRVYIEIETTGHEIGYRTVAVPRLDGINAIKKLLSAVEIRFAEVGPAFDRVLGPAVGGLNQTRLARHAEITVIEYGQAVANPRFSVIIPLYGRVDFVEYQLALFSAHDTSNTEFIYVLDDPPLRRESQFLFSSVFARFRIPFKAVLLDRNVGYAPANNIGLAQAGGTIVSFLNSDVFPGTPDWLERLADRLMADPEIGAIGPMLLFEDGSVQHRGMYFSRLEEFGNWYFGMHHGKGLRPLAGVSPETHLSITGACMLMTRARALEFGGFDETYVLGDFEDSDLCLRLRERGYRCVVDPGVQLFHLERKSQASSALGWRMNLTVYNAWRHQRRWGETIAAWQAR